MSSTQKQQILSALKSGEWRTLLELERDTGAPLNSLSSQLRQLRRPEFGGHDIRRRIRAHTRNLYEYRLIGPTVDVDSDQASA